MKKNQKKLILSINSRYSLSKVEGFTLIEVIVAVGIISLVLPVIFNIFFITLKSQFEFNELKKVKNNGDNAVNQIQNLIRNDATRLVKCTDRTTICQQSETYESPDGDFCFIQKTGKLVKIAKQGNNFVVQSTEEASFNYNFNLISISQVGLDMVPIAKCTGFTYSPPIVNYDFSLASSKSANVKLQYKVTSKLRNY